MLRDLLVLRLGCLFSGSVYVALPVFGFSVYLLVWISVSLGFDLRVLG